jgi:hypothetical protein
MRTMNDKLEAFFKARPGKWVDGLELAGVAGCYAWRSRCSDLRKRGMNIENRTRRVTLTDGEVITKSEYRYAPQGQLALL